MTPSDLPGETTTRWGGVPNVIKENDGSYFFFLERFRSGAFTVSTTAVLFRRCASRTGRIIPGSGISTDSPFSGFIATQQA